MEVNVIPCTAWVKKGVAAAIPEKIELRADELEQIIKETKSALESGDEESDEEETTSKMPFKIKEEPSIADSTDEYNFAAYDNEAGNMYFHVANIASFGTDGKDPLITNNDDDSEKEDDIIKSDDNLILIGHVEGDASILEVFVYNEKEGSFYCHHDILLPSFPLCIEWLNYDPADPSKSGNLCAIGNMTSIIEVWDLDLVDCLEPACKLGCKPSKKKQQKRVGHKDAILDVAWNQNYTHVLASGSVDQTVLLWDLENCKPVTKLDSFNEKVQALKWHPQETHRLLTGCADKLVRLFDCKEETLVQSWEMQGEVERVIWNHYDPNYCIASTDNGYIQYFDIRSDKSLWEIKAHEKEVTGLSLSTLCRGLLVSCSNDSVIKIWDLDQQYPTLLWENESNLGAIQCLAANPDNGFVFAIGGDNKAHNFKVLNLMDIPAVKQRFANANTSNNFITEIKQEENMDFTEDV